MRFFFASLVTFFVGNKEVARLLLTVFVKFVLQQNVFDCRFSLHTEYIFHASINLQ